MVNPAWFKWDGTITLGNLLTILGFGFAALKFYTKVVRFIDKLEMLIDEFPPHRHVDGAILFPKGMSPEAHTETT